MKPVNVTNAIVTRDTHLPTISFIGLRQDALFDYYSREPFVINVKETVDHDRRSYEQILRSHKSYPNQGEQVWYIYSEDRDKLSENLIIRLAQWHRNKDVEKLKTMTNREERLKMWPTITSKALFLDPNASSRLKELVANLDILISNGFVLEDSAEDKVKKYKNIEILRRVPWGQIHLTWDSSVKHNKVEEFIEQMEHEWMQMLSEPKANIYEMTFDYIHPIEVTKEYIYGERS